MYVIHDTHGHCIHITHKTFAALDMTSTLLMLQPTNQLKGNIVLESILQIITSGRAAFIATIQAKMSGSFKIRHLCISIGIQILF